MEILIGAIVSVIVEGAKKLFGTSRIGTLVFFLSLSFFAGATYVFVQNTEYLETFIKIAGTAALIYGVIINTYQKGLKN